MVVKTVKESAKYLDLTDFEAKALSALAEKFSREMLIYHCRMLEEALYSMQAGGAVKRIIAELCFVKMCDDTLSTSNEALLLRLSKLEARVASGVPVKPLQDKPEQKKEPAKEVEARAENEKKAVTFTQEPVREIKKAPVSADARSVKPLKAWSEAVQTIQSVDKGAYPFLKKTRAYIGEDNRIHVLNDGFSLFAIDRPDIKSALAAALSRYLERSVMPSDIIYEQDMGKIRLEDDNSDLDAFDDFMNN